MATPHLTGIYNPTLSKRRLAAVSSASGSHLLVLRRLSSWNDREFVVTPSKEWHVMAAGYGESTTTSTGNLTVWNESNTITNLCLSKFGSMDADSWRVGHKSLISWFGRWCAPSRVRYGDISRFQESNLSKFWEIGGSRSLLAFDLRHLNLRLNGSSWSFRGRLRFHCPSFGYVGPETGPLRMGRDAAHNNVSSVSYAIHPTVPAPSAYESSGYDSVDLYAHGNNGEAPSNGLYHAVPTDPYNVLHAGNETRTLVFGAYQRTRSYVKWMNNAIDYGDYYYDHVLSDAQKAVLKECMETTDGIAYLCIGPHIANGIAASASKSIYPGVVASLYCERVELILNITSGSFNV